MAYPLQGLLKKIKAYFVADVPAELAACEFDCRETDCNDEEWETCPKRLQKAEEMNQVVL